MKTTILKSAKLTNTGSWTTTITWKKITDGTGRTRITTKQRFWRNKKAPYEIDEIYGTEEFNKAYDDFHKKIARWI